jgi:murein DD-endopeptidase MepM/ murein hydrolase activator NlpD
MPRLRRSSLRASCAAFIALLGATATGLLIARLGTARGATVGQLQQQISAGRGRVTSLAGVVSAASGRLGRLRATIAGLERHIAQLQADLNAKRAELLRLRVQLSAARARLARLVAYEARAEKVLSHQLVASYESDNPDIITVVLESRGFQDLLERLAFAQRIRKQDVQIVTWVRSVRRAVAAQATRLGALEQRQQLLTAAVLRQRNSLDASRLALVQQEIALARFREHKAGELSSARADVATLRGRLARIEAAQAAAAAARARQVAASSQPAVVAPAASSGSSHEPVTQTPVQPSSGGGFTFPLPKGAASPPGTWSLDQGVDISAPGDTPEFAVCSGTIVLHGIGGFGPWAPVLHCDSPIGGYSYVYYGHAGPANQLPVGTHVGAGQVISSIGPGIVGISTGPHLEIGFADSSGGPIGGGSASTMLSLLQGSY